MLMSLWRAWLQACPTLFRPAQLFPVLRPGVGALNSTSWEPCSMSRSSGHLDTSPFQQGPSESSSAISSNSFHLQAPSIGQKVNLHSPSQLHLTSLYSAQLALTHKHHLLACRVNCTIQYNFCWQKCTALWKQICLLRLSPPYPCRRKWAWPHTQLTDFTTYKEQAFETTATLKLSIIKEFIVSRTPKGTLKKGKWLYPTYTIVVLLRIRQTNKSKFENEK